MLKQIKNTSLGKVWPEGHMQPIKFYNQATLLQ